MGRSSVPAGFAASLVAIRGRAAVPPGDGPPPRLESRPSDLISSIRYQSVAEPANRTALPFVHEVRV